MALLLGFALEVAKVPSGPVLWIGMICLATAAGFTLVITQWRSVPIGARIVIGVCLAALLIVAIDIAN